MESKKGNYINNKKNGTWKYYYENSSIVSEEKLMSIINLMAYGNGIIKMGK